MAPRGPDSAARAPVPLAPNSAERALQESEARFHAVADLVPDLLWQSEPDGATAWYNARWAQYTGQSREAAQGWGWTKAIHPDDRERSIASYRSAVERGGPFMHEHRIRAADGTYRWFLVRAEPQRDDAGRIVGWLGAATDINAQRMALDHAEWLAAQHAAERDTLRRQLAAAEESERRRLSRELHDSLGQHLTALALGLGSVKQRFARDGQPDGQIEQLEELTRTLTRDARALALELRPPELDDVGLESALATYAEQWTLRTGIEVDVTVTEIAEDHPVVPEVGTALYRIVQEALTNTAKHASARRVSVVLDQADGEVRLVIEDDGIGFDVDVAIDRARRQHRLGLGGMRERAALVGGTFEVESSPGAGTTIFVRIPQDDHHVSHEHGLAARLLAFNTELGMRAAAALDMSVALKRRRDTILKAMRELLAETRERSAGLRAVRRELKRDEGAAAAPPTRNARR